MRRGFAVRGGALQANRNQQRTLEPAAILVAAFQIHVRRPGEAIVFVQRRQVAGAGIKPNVENIVFFAESRPAAFGAGSALGNQFRSGLLEPDIGRMLGKQGNNRIQNLLVRQRMSAVIAVKHHDRHAPDTLARNTPVGPRGHHVGNAVVTPARNPLHGLDGIKSLLPQGVVFHADKPLVGGTVDGGIVAAPAMRVGVVDILQPQQGTGFAQHVHHERIALPNRFAQQCRRNLSRSRVGLEEAARRIHRAIHRQTILLAGNIVFLTMARRRVDRANTLLQRDVLAEQTN